MRRLLLSVLVGGFAWAAPAGPLAEEIFADTWRRIATNPVPPAAFAVDATVSSSGNDAYTVRERDGRLVFTGANARSLLYAVYDFFGRKGCRWFWDGDRLPPKGAVSVAGTDIREESRFEYRGIRYFAHRGLHRFQAEHWGLDDWKREIDWCVKNRLNLVMLRLGMDDTWQKAFPGLVPYPDPAKPLPEALAGYDNRSLFWSLQERGRLRKALTDYARERGLDVPTDFGTVSHWYSRTPRAYLDKVHPPFLPQADDKYREDTGCVFDVREPKWLDEYWKLTEAQFAAGYGDDRLLHTIGFGERRIFKDPAANFAFKCEVNEALIDLARRKRPNAKVLLAGWDFYYSWSADEVRRLVPRLDPARTVLWDYEADATDRSNFTDWGVVGKFPYVFGPFVCYEMALDVRANYPLIERRLAAAKDDSFCKGFVFWPESAHTDTPFLKYFVENAWRPDGKPLDQRLAEFCRDRYGADAATMEGVWQDVLPLATTMGWWGNAGMFLTGKGALTNALARTLKTPADAYTETMRAKTADVFRRLATVNLDDPAVARDAVDLARTAADRFLFYRQRSLAAANRLTSVWTLFADLLDQHADYSLNDSLQKLKAAAPVENPDFGAVLLDNCANGYCRSHQAELVRHWYLPFAREVERALQAEAQGVGLDTAKLDERCEALRQRLLKTPLEELAFRGERSSAALRAVLVKLSRETK